MEVSRRDVNYYCHICACEVVSQLNDVSQENVCGQCSSNFIELLGQGVETFIAGSTISPDNAVEQTVASPRERRRSEPIRRSEIIGSPFFMNDRNGQIPSQDTSRNLVSRDLQHAGSSGSHQHGTFTTSTFGTGPNIHSTDSRTVTLPIEIGSLMSAFMLGRNVSDNGGFSGFPGGASFEDFLHHIFLNESSHSGEPPATESVIGSLHRTVVSSSAEILELGECSISQEAFEIGDISICLPCKHTYKEEPITHWLKMHNSCPVCRIPLSAPGATCASAVVETLNST